MGMAQGELASKCLSCMPTKGDDVPSPERSAETADRGWGRDRSADIALVEIAKLQSDAEHLKVAMREMRADMREVRDRRIGLKGAFA